MNKKIAIFCHDYTFTHQRFGIQKVAAQVLRGLQDEFLETPDLSADFYLRSEEENPVKKLIWDQLYPSLLPTHDAYLFFTYKAPVFFNKNAFVLIHDVTYLTNPAWFTNNLNIRYTKFLVERISQNPSYKILTTCEFTKGEIIKTLNISEDRVFVFTPPVSESFEDFTPNADRLSVIKQKYHIDAPYLFFAGNISPRKNMEGALKAFAKAKKQTGSKVKFAMAGQFGWDYGNIGHIIRENNLESDIVFMGYVAEEDLPYVFEGAEFCYYPSFYEGFGFPVLESLVCQTPVITSKNSPMEELKGRGVVLIDPYDIDEMSESLIYFMKNKSKQLAKLEMEIPTARTAAREIIQVIKSQL